MSDQIKYEFTDPETGEVFPVNGTSLVSNVRDILMSRRRNQVEAKTWSMLNEAEQQDEITAVQELARDLVGKVVELVAEKGLVCAHVAIQKFAVDVDKGVVQITSSGFASDQMLTDLAHSKGKVAKLTVVDERQFNEKSTLLVADKDQPSLLPEDDASGDEFTSDDSDALAKSGQDAAGGELSDQDIEDIGAQMDAEADGMDEPDDLHDPEPDQPVADPASDDQVAGYHARMQGYSSKAGPSIDAPERNDWYLGWKKADGQDDAPDVDETLHLDPDQEPETSDVETDGADNEPDLGDLTPMQHGQQARLKGDGPDDNPFDGGADGHAEWAGGYEAADAEIKTLIEAGRKAGADGEDKKKCPWKKGTDGERFWLEGWNAGQADA